MSTETNEKFDFNNFKEDLEWNNYDFSEGDTIIVKKSESGEILKSVPTSGVNTEGKNWSKDQLKLFVEFNGSEGWMNINKKILKTLAMACNKNTEKLVGKSFVISQIADPTFPHIVFRYAK